MSKHMTIKEAEELARKCSGPLKAADLLEAQGADHKFAGAVVRRVFGPTITRRKIRSMVGTRKTRRQGTKSSSEWAERPCVRVDRLVRKAESLGLRVL